MYVVAGISRHSNNQSFWIQIDDIEYMFRLHTFRDVLYCSISANGTLLIAGIKCVNNSWLIPYRHLSAGGNFRFENSYDDYVDPQYFGEITKLVYYPPDEIAEMEAASE